MSMDHLLPADSEKLASRSHRLAAAAELLPSHEDIKAELPEGAVQGVDYEDGTCEGKVVGHENIRRLMAMRADYNRAKVEIGAEMNAEIETTKINHPTRGVIDCPAHLERTICLRQGARPAHGRRPSWIYRGGRYYDARGNEMPEPPTHPSWPWARAG